MLDQTPHKGSQRPEDFGKLSHLREAEASSLATDKGFELFLEPENAVQCLLDKERFLKSDWRSKEGELSSVFLRGSNEEQGCFWDMIHKASSDKSEVLTRQAVIDALVDPDFAFQEFRQAQVNIYAVGKSLEYLLDVGEKERHRAMDEGRTPKNRLEILLDRGFSPENFSEELTKARETIAEESWISHPREEKIVALNHVLQAGAYAQTLGELTKNIDNPTLQNMGKQLEALASALPTYNIEEIIKALLERTELYQKLDRATSKLSSKVRVLGGISLFVDLVKETEMGRASFNEEESQGYHSAWNLTMDKGDPSKDRGSLGPTPQVLNDSPEDLPLTILASPNMSGKSFFMEGDLYLRLCGQAFGYIPAAAGNLHLYENFVMLNRASTKSSRGLSAFGNEVKRWLKAYKCRGGRTCLYADESFSTTDPKDQYRLLSADTDYFMEKPGSRLMVASHNEKVLERYSGRENCGVYHFATRMPKKGDIEFLYRLKKGNEESYALAVARQLGLSEEVLERAERFLRGDLQPVTDRKVKVKPIERYSEVERERLKTETGNFGIFCPKYDYLVTDEYFVVGEEHTRYALEWSRKKERELQENKDLQEYKDFWEEELYELGEAEASDEPEEAEEPEEKTASKEERFFNLLSQEDDFKYGFNLTGIKGESSDYLEKAHEFLLEGAASDPKEILERQKMFQEMIGNPDWAERFWDSFVKTWSLHWAANIVGPASLAKFNKVLLEQLESRLSREWFDEDHCFGEFFRAAIDLNCRLLKIDPEEAVLTEMLGTLDRLNELGRQVRQIKDDYDKLDYGVKNLEKMWAERDAVVRKAAETAGVVYQKGKTGLVDSYRQVFYQIMAKFNPLVKEVSLFDLDLDEIRPLLPALLAKADQWAKEHTFMPDPVVLVRAMDILLDPSPRAEQMISQMRELDSVHLHQLANYFKVIMEVSLNGCQSGTDLLNLFEKRYAEADLRYGCGSGFSSDTWDRVRTEMRRLAIPFKLAEVMREERFCPANLNETGEVIIRDGWSIIDKQNEQIHNSPEFGPDTIICLLRSPNMSGKTYFSKGVVWAELFVHATGMAPASFMSTPVFDGIYYMDRVSEKLERNLSYFGSDVKLWSSLLGDAMSDRHVFCAVDEAFSTTSPRYQSAMTYAAMETLLENGQNSLIALHNHDCAEAFYEQYSDHTIQHHFKTHLGEKGDINFDYLLRPGPAESLAIPVAAKLGFPKEILEAAEKIPLD